ncbi:cysteine desulfurase family protein [Emcibacter sp. SYSU 3D8]|uniref:cysteine desulfurase family protein n=1 Tax=Emcibacter sp. SYSU 3D8 TaxID=3133969 RepID=UPI0031FF1020
MNRLVYLDGHATTPLAPEAAEAMARLWAEQAGNAHSPHARGQAAAVEIERARTEVALLIGAAPSEVVFTSGATEANNLALLGVAEAARETGQGRRRIVASAIEHRSVLAVLEELGGRGFETCLAPVTRDGLVDLYALEEILNEGTLLVSVMGANNEMGALQRLKIVASAAHKKGALVHSDLAQLAGKLPVDVATLELDYASLSAHKLHGPMGVGALYVSALASLRPRPLMFGGGQEGNLRPGTLPTPLIAGFGAAARRARLRMGEDGERQAALAERMLIELKARHVRFIQNVASAARLPGSLSLQFPGIDADELVGRLSDVVCLSTGSACSAGHMASSYVLKAMNLTEAESSSTLRMYFDRYVSEDDVGYAADKISAAVRASLVTGSRVQ